MTDTDEAVMLMIASSSDSLTTYGKQEPMKLNELRPPLYGVKHDVQKFKQKFSLNKFHLIETSRWCDILLSKRYVTSWLANHFKKATSQVYLYYVGHGHSNGDWAI